MLKTLLENKDIKVIRKDDLIIMGALNMQGMIYMTNRVDFWKACYGNQCKFYTLPDGSCYMFERNLIAPIND